MSHNETAKQPLPSTDEPAMKPPMIGVLGGVGPQAGIDFLDKIFANTIAKRDQDHLNCVLISCPSIITDRTGFLVASQNVENPAIGMFESARRLYLAGARFITVACNTAHAGPIFGPFCKRAEESFPELRIVNMLETSAAYVKETLQLSRLGLLAAKGTHLSRVYHEYFRAEDGFLLLEPDEAGQEKIHEAIYSEDFGLKAFPKEIKHQVKARMKEEIEKLIGKGAQTVILGCTELPLAVIDATVPLIDPAVITARKLISLVAPEKMLPASRL
jgi:aspartate racemase